MNVTPSNILAGVGVVLAVISIFKPNSYIVATAILLVGIAVIVK